MISPVLAIVEYLMTNPDLRWGNILWSLQIQAAFIEYILHSTWLAVGCELSTNLKLVFIPVCIVKCLYDAGIEALACARLFRLRHSVYKLVFGGTTVLP